MVAPGRGARPGAFAAPAERPVRQTPEQCPFCAGHEDQTPPPTLVLPATGAWRVRVVPNLFPALDAPHGGQEVAIHAPQHALSLADLDSGQLGLIAEAWGERSAARRSQGWRYLFPFVNEGAGSGASLDHSHSQLIVFADLPALVARRLGRFEAGCPVCDELGSLGDDRTVIDAGGLVAWTPWASHAPYHLRLAPRAHAGDALADHAHIGQALGVIARSFVGALGPVPWNAWVYTAPLAGSATLHWHIEAYPRVASLAALELGAGLPICQVDPVQAAREFRAVLIA